MRKQSISLEDVTAKLDANQISMRRLYLEPYMTSFFFYLQLFSSTGFEPANLGHSLTTSSKFPASNSFQEVLDMACCICMGKEKFSTRKYNISFTWDKCCHLTSCLHLMPTNLHICKIVSFLWLPKLSFMHIICAHMTAS